MSELPKIRGPNIDPQFTGTAIYIYCRGLNHCQHACSATVKTMNRRAISRVDMGFYIGILVIWALLRYLYGIWESRPLGLSVILTVAHVLLLHGLNKYPHYGCMYLIELLHPMPRTDLKMVFVITSVSLSLKASRSLILSNLHGST